MPSSVQEAMANVREPARTATPAQSARARRFPHVKALDGVRGLAALAVLLHHCLFTGLPPVAATWPWPTLVVQSLCAHLYLGVDLFFVLSGYLITSLLLLARRGPNYYHNFYWKRAFRILPALLLILAITYALGYTPLSSVALALLFVSNFSNLWGLTEIGPFWSLSIEEQFYLAWPALVRQVSPRTMVRVLLGLIVAPALLRVLSTSLHHGRFHYTFVHCDPLAWGGLLALMAYRQRVPFHHLNAARLWQRYGRWFFWIGVAGAGITIPTERRVGDYGQVLTFAGPLFTGLLLYLITHRNALVAFLSSRPLRFLGDVSYMFYLSHAYILNIYDLNVTSWHTNPTPGGMYLRFFVALAATLLFCTASLYWFERPLGKLRRWALRPA